MFDSSTLPPSMRSQSTLSNPRASNKRPKRRTLMACFLCRDKKLKCAPSDTPSQCQRCLESNVKCVKGPVGGVRPPAQPSPHSGIEMSWEAAGAGCLSSAHAPSQGWSTAGTFEPVAETWATFNSGSYGLQPNILVGEYTNYPQTAHFDLPGDMSSSIHGEPSTLGPGYLNSHSSNTPAQLEGLPIDDSTYNSWMPYYASIAYGNQDMPADGR